MNLLAVPADAVPDAAFTADRAQLPARLGGLGISLLSNRHLYLNMLTTVLTQLIDRVGGDETVTPGLFNDQAARNLVPGSFDHTNKENRLRTFLASESALAVEFRDEHERAKALLSQRAANLSITDPRWMVFYAKSKDPFSKSLLSDLPVPNICFTHT
jgi:hypothetical protein